MADIVTYIHVSSLKTIPTKSKLHIVILIGKRDEYEC
jgi:hypothetical protein